MIRTLFVAVVVVLIALDAKADPILASHFQLECSVAVDPGSRETCGFRFNPPTGDVACITDVQVSSRVPGDVAFILNRVITVDTASPSKQFLTPYQYGPGQVVPIPLEGVVVNNGDNRLAVIGIVTGFLAESCNKD